MLVAFADSLLAPINAELWSNPTVLRDLLAVCGPPLSLLVELFQLGLLAATAAAAAS